MSVSTFVPRYKQVKLELPTILDVSLGSQSSTATPLYLIHPGAGVAVPYCYLNSVGDRPVRGVSNTFLSNGHAFESVADAATHYIAEIEHAEEFLYGDAPNYDEDGAKTWFLGGWSYGGVVALEMAAQLIERGDRVEGVILFDSVHTAGIYDPIPFALPTEEALQNPAPYDTSAADRSIRSGAAGAKASSGSDGAMHDYLRLCYMHAESLLSRHVPRALPTTVPVRLVKAGRLQAFARSVSPTVRIARIKKHVDPSNGWSELIPSIKVTTVDASHDDMFNGPGLALTQGVFDGIMEEFAC